MQGQSSFLTFILKTKFVIRVCAYGFLHKLQNDVLMKSLKCGLMILPYYVILAVKITV